MHSDVDQDETSTTGLTPDSEMFTVLSAEAARVAGEEVQPRKPLRVRSCTDAANTSQGRTNKNDAKKKDVCFNESFFPRAEPSRRNPGSVLRSHGQRVLAC